MTIEGFRKKLWMKEKNPYPKKNVPWVVLYLKGCPNLALSNGNKIMNIGHLNSDISKEIEKNLRKKWFP